jgi:hypothetical protein
MPKSLDDPTIWMTLVTIHQLLATDQLLYVPKFDAVVGGAASLQVTHLQPPPNVTV